MDDSGGFRDVTFEDGHVVFRLGRGLVLWGPDGPVHSVDPPPMAAEPVRRIPPVLELLGDEIGAGGHIGEEGRQNQTDDQGLPRFR